MKLSSLTAGRFAGRTSTRQSFCQVLIMLADDSTHGLAVAVSQIRPDGRWVSLYEDGISGSGRSWGPGPLDGDCEEPGR